MTALSVAIKRLDHAADLALPASATADSAGLDLLAAVEASISLAPGARRLIPTGVAIALPPGTQAQVRPPSRQRGSAAGRGRVWQAGAISGRAAPCQKKQQNQK